MFLFLHQTAWTAIAAVGSIAVATIAIIPILKDRARIKLHIRNINEIGKSGRYKLEISVTNVGRRIAYIESIQIGYVDTAPVDIKIAPSETELHEGNRRVYKQDSWPLTAMSKVKYLVVVDSLGRKWQPRSSELKAALKALELRNSERPKTARQLLHPNKNRYHKQISKKKSLKMSNELK